MLYLFYTAALVAINALQTTASIPNWDIIYQSLNTNFVQGATDDITITYLIGTYRDYNIELYTNDCDTAITGMSSLNVVENISRDYELDPLHDQLELIIDVDIAEIASSNIWDDINKTLEFCSVVQLLSGGDVIKDDKQGIDITFDFNVDYDFDVNIIAKVETPTEEVIDNYHISVCKCSSHLSDCDTDQINSGETLGLCIMTTNSNTQLVSIRSLSLLQDNTAELMDVMQDNAIVNPALSTLTEVDSQKSFISTTVPNEFFGTNDNVVIDGAVEVRFVSGARRLVKFRFDNTAK